MRPNSGGLDYEEIHAGIALQRVGTLCDARTLLP